MSTIAAVAMATALAAVPTAGAAQCRLCESPTTSRGGGPARGEIRLEVESSLDFDRLILISPGEGSATLRPDGSRSVSGAVGSIGGRAMVGSAQIRGEAGRAVRVRLPRRIELHSVSGARIVIEDIISDLAAAPRLDRSGTLDFRFGGRLQVSGDAEGDYRGDIPITVEYL